MDRRHDQLASLVNAVKASAKYRDVNQELITRIAAQELSKGRSEKDTIKATKNKLHQVGGAYLDKREHYTRWLDDLEMATRTGQRERLLELCRIIMTHHASTRERIPILEQFYTQIFRELPPIRSILDIACGLNPLAIPWMPLPENGIEYYAYDIYHGMMDFLQAWLGMMHVGGNAQVRDVIQTCPTQPVDVAFLLKAIPCLEQVDKAAGHRLLSELHVSNLVVSFPTQSLGGQSKGMLEHYETHFYKLLGNELRWEVKKLAFDTELVFIVRK